MFTIMETDNIIVNKSKSFAIRIVKLYKYLHKEKNEYILCKQVLRSGTSIGANIAEAVCAISKKDFVAKCILLIKKLLKHFIG